MLTAVAIVALLLPLARAACIKNYTVKGGDTCDAIAAANGVSSYQVSTLNPNACNSLWVGQSLCLASDELNCTPVYTVVSGDYCYGIAEKFGITLDQFLANNKQLNAATCAIYPGMTVCVQKPGGTTPSASQSPTSTQSSNPAPTGCLKVTTIQPGDSCDAIALRTGTISTYGLQQINPPNTCATLISGNSICVDRYDNNCSKGYQVKGTEGGCYNIAQQQGIELATLYSLNPNVDSVNCANIYVGQVLCVSPRSSTPPVGGSCTRHYTAVIGDTCTRMAAKNSLTNVQLGSINPTLDCSAISAGAEYCSYNPSLNICPKLVIVTLGQSCWSLAQNVSMSVDEWTSINAGINCDALLPGSVVCSAQGNATLPDAPSGSNPTALPLCGNYDKKKNCCTRYSVSADLHSPFCKRENGCQDNCNGDPGVGVPQSPSTPTTTIIVTDFPDPTPPPSQCGTCTATQCCSAYDTCEEADSLFCMATNGCKTNCDKGSAQWVSPPWQGIVYDGYANTTFPPGNFSSTDGNPCGVCSKETRVGLESPSGQYCCTRDIECTAQELSDCLVGYGCLYNCLDVTVDYDACERGACGPETTRTVKHPFATSA